MLTSFVRHLRCLVNRFGYTQYRGNRLNVFKGPPRYRGRQLNHRTLFKLTKLNHVRHTCHDVGRDLTFMIVSLHVIQNACDIAQHIVYTINCLVTASLHCPIGNPEPEAIGQVTSAIVFSYGCVCVCLYLASVRLSSLRALRFGCPMEWF